SRGTSGLTAIDALAPRLRICCRVFVGSGQVSGWTDTQSAPASMNSGAYLSGSVIIKWTSSGTRAALRTASTTNGPIVRFGTKWPSIISTWSQSAPASSTARICSPRQVKSDDSIEGAIFISGLSHPRGEKTVGVVAVGQGGEVFSANHRFGAGRQKVPRVL